MKNVTFALLLTLALVFFGLYIRELRSKGDSHSNDVQALKAQIQTLQDELEAKTKIIEQLPTPTPTPNHVASQPDEFREFMRESRRLVAAIEAGLSLDDLSNRQVDINASAEEAIRAISDQQTKEHIAEFVETLADTKWFWHFANSSADPDSSYGIVTVPRGADGKISYAGYSFVANPEEGERLAHLSEFIAKYKLEPFYDDKKGTLYSRQAVQSMLTSTAHAFRVIDDAGAR